MSLANLDGSYRSKVRNLTESIIRVDMRVGADGKTQERNPEQPPGGYIRIRFKPKGSSKIETVHGAKEGAGTIRFTVGGTDADAREIERKIDALMTMLAADGGSFWVEALYTGEQDAREGSFRVESDGGGKVTDIDDFAAEKGAGAALLLAASRLIENLGRINVEQAREAAGVREAHSRMYAEIATLKEREGYTRLIAQAEGRDRMWAEIAPHLSETAQALLGSPAIQDLIRRAGGAAPAAGDDVVEQPAKGRDRVAWDLDQAATVLEDAAGHFDDIVAGDAEVQGHLTRIQEAARKILAYYKPPPAEEPAAGAAS